ncbi:Cupin domain-containing protein [Croceitalea dokdonensis DOKDO 023]|uniref:Cupin domain-containing protein n=1 Tax=Croceitalea dokdonensis DOKDO 023 TaxID=1300341 RepID=A0A0P7AF85_9FLAO|nr:cupin domain-containing protein [Croceitalea dokdonensis]KPM31959.1 Cupin domain-containing protein [Croceitalea dokdonensis DOKDO 023]
MKIQPIVILLVLPLMVSAQKLYEVSSYLEEGFKAPNTHYIGEAWLNRLVEADSELDIHITKATFKANATLDWHKHGSAQVLIYVAGEGYYQERGKEPVILKAGDVVRCKKETERWHSSTKNSDVTYIALYSGETPTVWTEMVTHTYYDNVAQQLGH